MALETLNRDKEKIDSKEEDIEEKVDLQGELICEL